MNLVGYLIIFSIGVMLWWRSGVRLSRKYFWLGLGIMLVLWWGVWGQLAVADGWWTYSHRSIPLGYIGVVPAADLFYFFAGLGWYFYLCHKLDLF